MNTLIQLFFIIALYVLIRSADMAISASIVRDIIRAIFYGIVAILALIYIVITLFGLQ